MLKRSENEWIENLTEQTPKIKHDHRKLSLVPLYNVVKLRLLMCKCAYAYRIMTSQTYFGFRKVCARQNFEIICG